MGISYLANFHFALTGARGRGGDVLQYELLHAVRHPAPNSVRRGARGRRTQPRYESHRTQVNRGMCQIINRSYHFGRKQANSLF